jgi:uncharacterized membrane protein HdeD (DUF308 family)
MSDALEILSKQAQRIIFLGLGLIALGIVVLVYPQQSGMTVAFILGLLLLIGGLLRLAFAWLSVSWGDTFLRFLFGLLAVLAGGYMMVQPAIGLQALTIVVIIYLIADGISEIIFALRVPPATGGTLILLSGAVTLLLGVLLWLGWPWSGEKAIGLMIGLKLLLDGVALVGIGMTARRRLKTVGTSPTEHR